MKTELTFEQSQRLIELGVNPYLASKEVTEKHPISENEIPYNIFTLTDLFGILPKWLKYRNMLLWLNIWIDLYTETWCVAYKDALTDIDEADSFQSLPELIDALYELTIWLIENKYLQL